MYATMIYIYTYVFKYMLSILIETNFLHRVTYDPDENHVFYTSIAERLTIFYVIIRAR